MSDSLVVSVARCPEHGLHGCRDTCFECGGPVEQVSMIAVDDLLTADECKGIMWALQGIADDDGFAYPRDSNRVILRSALAKIEALGSSITAAKTETNG